MKEIVIGLGQGGGPTPVINDTLAGALDQAQVEANERKINIRMLGFGNSARALMPRGEFIDLAPFSGEIFRGVPGAALGTARYKLEDRDMPCALERLKEKKINLVLWIGGNDTAENVAMLGRAVHASKTIDNDLLLSHHTPGFGSAAKFHAMAARCLDLDLNSFAYSTMNRKEFPVSIYQTMGRETGWLAHSTAFAKFDEKGRYRADYAPHIIWPAELLFDEIKFLFALGKVLKDRKGILIVVSEGLKKIVDGEEVELAKICGKVSTDAHGHSEYSRAGSGSAADYVANLVREFDKNLRTTIINPGHLQRCFARSETDAEDAYKVGRESIRALLEGDFGVSIVLKKTNGLIKPVRVPVERIAAQTRYVDHEFWDGDICGPNELFFREFRPCLGYELALPRNLREIVSGI
jgi:6-phosphofructokinase 1